jgi:hypothetical protein
MSALPTTLTTGAGAAAAATATAGSPPPPAAVVVTTTPPVDDLPPLSPLTELEDRSFLSSSQVIITGNCYTSRM